MKFYFTKCCCLACDTTYIFYAFFIISSSIKYVQKNVIVEEKYVVFYSTEDSFSIAIPAIGIIRAHIAFMHIHDFMPTTF